MARHSGKNGILKIGGTPIGDVVDFDFETAAAEVDVSALNDAWDDYDSGSLSWSGNVTVRFNTADAQQQLLVSGAVLAAELFTEGDAVGKVKFAGNILVLNVGRAVSRNSAVDKKVSFRGKGALTDSVIV